jgi:hypothetical protein
MNGITTTVDTMVIMITTTGAITVMGITIDIGTMAIGATDPGTPASGISIHQDRRSLLVINNDREASAVAGREFL